MPALRRYTSRMPPRSRPPDVVAVGRDPARAGHSPTDIFPFPVGKTPPNDRAYFEMMTWFVFGAGLNWKIMRSKWPAFTKAFRNYSLIPVSKFGESDIDRLLADTSIVRNGKKMVSTIENARTIRAIAKEHGGMTAWIRTYGADVGPLIKDTKKQFRHIGDTTARLFLCCAGAIEYQTWLPTEAQKKGRR